MKMRMMFAMLLILAALGTACGGAETPPVVEAQEAPAAETEEEAVPAAVEPGPAAESAAEEGTAEAYQVDLDPDAFVEIVDNPYFPLIPGSSYVYEGETEDGLERVEITILPQTRNVMGIRATVYHDAVYMDGELIEETYDWFAQDAEGNVWYLGEDVDNYEDGKFIDHDGAWEAGVDGAQPGIVMFGDPAAHLGETYLQEYYAGEAEDTADLLSISESVAVPAGSFENVLQTYDYTPLDPESQEHKFYAPGVGTIKTIDLITGEEFVLVEYASGGTATGAEVTCAAAGAAEVTISDARLYVEFNATDEDLGVHGGFDDDGWSELCVYAPDGEQILGVRPQAELGGLTMASIFFESREPALDEFDFADLEAGFAEGMYSVRALSYDGSLLTGAAWFTYDVPVEPEVLSPLLVEEPEETETAVVPLADLLVSWEPVTETVNGDPLTLNGYELIITTEEHDDPHGYSRPIYDVHVAPETTSLRVPAEFFASDTIYELEVLALEESGNQTITVGFFKTE
jgi:hypothetical protein